MGIQPGAGAARALVAFTGVALVLLFGAAPAVGGTLEIEYEFTDGTISGFPDFTSTDEVLGGTALLRLEATGPATPTITDYGTGTLVSFSAFGSNNGIRFTSANTIRLARFAGGALGAYYTPIPPAYTGPSFSNYQGSGYSMRLAFDLTAQTVDAFLSVLSFTGGTTLYGGLDATGREVTRTFVPEPSSGLLVGSGLAALALGGGSAARWRRRRSAEPRTPQG